ncbi:MAG: Asp23/Gls24 family envelope stress response protein [Clostridiales bacterium]
MEEFNNELYDDTGELKISEEVVAIISGISATEIDGIAGMSSSLAGEIVEMLGRKNLSKGVKVEVGEKEAAIDLYVIVNYGYRIPEVSWQVQEKVKKGVEKMTGLKVIEVNIHVQGINFDKVSNNNFDESDEEI